MLNELHSELRQSVPNLCSFADEHDIQVLPEHEQIWAIPEPILVDRSTESLHSSAMLQGKFLGIVRLVEVALFYK